MSRLRDNAKLRQAFTDWKDGGGDIWTVLDELDRALASPSPGAGGGETPGNALKEHCAIRLSGRHCPLHGELPAVPAAEPGKPAPLSGLFMSAVGPTCPKCGSLMIPDPTGAEGRLRCVNGCRP